MSVPNPSYDRTKPPSQTNPQNVYSGPGGNHSISYGGTFTIGTFNPANPATWGKVGRNEACPCGSGKKYKHCHGALVA